MAQTAHGHVWELLRARADLNVVDPRLGTSPLIYALRQHNVELLKALLVAGANPNFEADKEKPLWIALRSMHMLSPNEVSLLLEYGASVVNGNSPAIDRSMVHCAIKFSERQYYGDYETKLAALLRHGATTNTRAGRKGVTPLEYARITGRPVDVECLENHTPFAWAIGCHTKAPRPFRFMVKTMMLLRLCDGNVCIMLPPELMYLIFYFVQL